MIEAHLEKSNRHEKALKRALCGERIGCRRTARGFGLILAVRIRSVLLSQQCGELSYFPNQSHALKSFQGEAEKQGRATLFAACSAFFARACRRIADGTFIFTEKERTKNNEKHHF